MHRSRDDSVTHQPLHFEGEERTKGKDHPQDRTGDES